MAELKDRLPAREILEAVLAERLQRRFGRQAIATQIVRELGYKRLSAVTDVKQTRHVVERRPEVVAIADFRGACMQRNPGANRGLFRPPLRAERALRGERRLDRAGRGGEGGAE